jgi:hypothetical protein
MRDCLTPRLMPMVVVSGGRVEVTKRTQEICGATVMCIALNVAHPLSRDAWGTVCGAPDFLRA